MGIKNKDFSTVSTDDLIKKLKQHKIANYLLAGSLLLLTILNIYNMLTESSKLKHLFPFAMLPLLLHNIKTAKRIKEELNNRK